MIAGASSRARSEACTVANPLGMLVASSAMVSKIRNPRAVALKAEADRDLAVDSIGVPRRAMASAPRRPAIAVVRASAPARARAVVRFSRAELARRPATARPGWAAAIAL